MALLCCRRRLSWADSQMVPLILFEGLGGAAHDDASAIYANRLDEQARSQAVRSTVKPIGICMTAGHGARFHAGTMQSKTGAAQKSEQPNAPKCAKKIKASRWGGSSKTAFFRYLSFYDLAAAQAGGADAHLARTAVHARPYRPQVDVPAPLGHVVRVADVIARTRPFAANLTYLCHRLLPESARMQR
jgi:hypothetical protein